MDAFSSNGLFAQLKQANHQYILGTRVDGTSYESTSRLIRTQVESGEYSYVCVANVHMIMEAFDSDKFKKIINKATIVTPDGVPLVWTMRFLGIKKQNRVYGPTLMGHVCEVASKHNLPIGFYGGSPETITYLVKNISNRYPSLQIAYAYSPPFKLIGQEEDPEVVRNINNSGAKILFVGLGCPKQEHWMYNHLGKINAVMIGVGAAFDYYAGIKKQAPSWIMDLGFEWLFRLCMEPRRLWRRYLYNNPRYLYLVGRQILRERQLRN